MSILESGRIFQLVTLILLIVVIVYYFTQADKGKSWFIRKFAGVDRIDDALKLATELQRPVHYAVGDLAELSGPNVAQVVAGFETMQYIASFCAKNKTKLIVTLCGRSGGGGEMVPITNELVRNVYQKEGALEDFKIGETVRYVSGERPVYHAAMQRIFVEENVASSIMVGPWAGSIWGVTALGGAMGVYQITGTALLWEMPEQTCIVDHMMYGEEMFAVGAILSGDRNAQASLKVQDFVKYFVWLFTLLGAGALLAGSTAVRDLLRW